jgi:hypothetical protein
MLRCGVALAVAEETPGGEPDDTCLARDSVGGHRSPAQVAAAKAQAAALKAKVDAQSVFRADGVDGRTKAEQNEARTSLSGGG